MNNYNDINLIGSMGMNINHISTNTTNTNGTATNSFPNPNPNFQTMINGPFIPSNPSTPVIQHNHSNPIPPSNLINNNPIPPPCISSPTTDSPMAYQTLGNVNWRKNFTRDQREKIVRSIYHELIRVTNDIPGIGPWLKSSWYELRIFHQAVNKDDYLAKILRRVQLLNKKMCSLTNNNNNNNTAFPNNNMNNVPTNIGLNNKVISTNGNTNTNTNINANLNNNVNEDTSYKYWQRLEELKDKHYNDVTVVHGAFDKYVKHLKDNHAGSDNEQKKKLQYLLRYVEHVVVLFSENRKTHLSRPLQELDKIEKYINKIVLPYLNKLNSEKSKRQNMANANQNKTSNPTVPNNSNNNNHSHISNQPMEMPASMLLGAANNTNTVKDGKNPNDDKIKNESKNNEVQAGKSTSSSISTNESKSVSNEQNDSNESLTINNSSNHHNDGNNHHDSGSHQFSFSNDSPSGTKLSNDFNSNDYPGNDLGKDLSNNPSFIGGNNTDTSVNTMEGLMGLDGMDMGMNMGLNMNMGMNLNLEMDLGMEMGILGNMDLTNLNMMGGLNMDNFGFDSYTVPSTNNNISNGSSPNSWNLNPNAI